MWREDRVGAVVRIYYRGGIKGQEPIDVKVDGEPLTVILGAGRIPRGLESALFDMELGEERVVEIPADLGYGKRDENGCYWYSRAMLEGGYDLAVGDAIPFNDMEQSRTLTVWIVDATEDAVKLDFNHPFAGHTLEYWVKVIE